MQAKSIASNRLIGDYELLDDGCEGGMGIVYRARQRRLNRIVALKMIRFSQQATPFDMQRFIVEAQACGQLQHENIVPIYEAAEYQGKAYFTMAYIEGGDLRAEIQRLDGRAMEIHRAVRLVGTVARAVHHAHERGVLHRDLKPGNILLDRVGKPFVTDFGLAKFFQPRASAPDGLVDADLDDPENLGDSSEITRYGQRMGSSGYTSPEQALGRSDELTTACDVFSLGVIFYRLVTGQAPFPTDDWEDFVHRASRGIFPRPSKFNPQVDADLEAIIDHCLEPNPELRAKSAASLAEQLDHWSRHEPLDPEWRTTPIWERGYKWVRRHRAMTGLIATFVIIAGLLLSVDTLRRKSAQQDNLARENRLLNLLTKADEEFASGDARAGLQLVAQVVRESPSHPTASEFLINILRQRSFLIPTDLPTIIAATGTDRHNFRSARTRDGGRTARAIHSSIELEELSTGRSLRISELGGVVRSVAFSLDGRFVVSGSDDGVTRIWNTATGQLRVAMTNPAPVVYAEFSPDGIRLIAALADGRVCFWNVDRAELVGKPLVLGSSLAAAHFSPSGIWIATAAVDGGVRIWDAVTRRLVADPLLVSGVVDVRFDKDERIILAENENGSCQAFQVTHTLPLVLGRTNEVPKPALPLPTLKILGVDSTNFHAEAVTSFQMSPDKRVLATASVDGTARLWDARTYQPVTKPLRHGGIVNCICFSPDGSRVATSTSDRKVRVWRTNSGQPLTDWLVFDEPVDAVAFSVDGRRVVTSSGWGWELYLPAGPMPAWLPQLADYIASPTDPKFSEQLSAVRREISSSPGLTADWAKRLLAMQ